MNSIFQKLWPTKGRMIIFATFILMVWASNIQAWVFNGKGMGVEKPLFFDKITLFCGIV